MTGWFRMVTGLATLAALTVGGWYLFDLVTAKRIEGDGIRIILRFDNAHGVPVGGGILHKGVRVGDVLDVDVAPDDSGVLMEVRVEPEFGHTLRRDSRFWIVRPKFSGLTQGVTGLDTLIKDPYVEFDTPDLSSPVLVSGSLAYGLTQAPVSEGDIYLSSRERRSARHTFKVRFLQAQGLREGAPVLYRDVAVGKVLGVDLSLDGRSVEADVVIHERYRETVRTDSIFWIARPNVEVGLSWSSLVNVNDLGKILTGAALTYATPSDSRGRAVKKGDLFVGHEGPPEELAELKGPLVNVEPPGGSGWPGDPAAGLMSVGITFAFLEADWTGDERFLLEGSGLLYPAKDGRILVLTARSLADGSWSADDTFSRPDIESSDLTLRFADRTVGRASLIWTDPEKRDLAVLALEGEAGDIRPGPPRFLSEGGEEESGEYYLLIAFREGGEVRTQPIPRDQVLDPGKTMRRFHEDLALDVREWMGAVLADEQGRILGVVGREEALSKDPVVSVIDRLPELDAAPAAGGEDER